MFDIDSTIEAIFLGAFFFGLLFAIGSLVLGAVDLGGDHGDVGHETSGGLHDYLNLSVVLGFVAWFGGVGYLASSGAGWTAAVSILVAIGGGLVGAAIVYQLFSRFIRPAGRIELDPRDFELQGKLARVTSTIRPGGTGEIVYEQSGARMVRPARSSSGLEIPRGTEVVVLRSEGAIGYVAPWTELYGEQPVPLAPAKPSPLGESAVTTEEPAT